MGDQWVQQEQWGLTPLLRAHWSLTPLLPIAPKSHRLTGDESSVHSVSLYVSIVSP